MKVSQHFVKQKKLTQALSEFGLSPQEWQVRAENQHCYVIKNKNSPDFYFIGYTDKRTEKPKWQRLQLAGL